MSKSDSLMIQASSLQLAASCLNLVKAIAESSLEGNAIAVATRTFLAWMAKEDIEESHYNEWARQTARLASVNENGLKMIRDLRHRAPKKTVAGIPVSFTGSVGRAMAFEPDHQYLVTTVAVLMSFHNLEFAVKTLTNMTFDRGDHSKGINYRYDVSRAFVARTMEKVVHSIALNVVNSGYSTEDLPASLAKFYKNRVADKDTFAAVVMALQPKHDAGVKDAPDILIDCDVLYGDITSWVLSHFHGVLQVSISGEVIYSSSLGQEKQKLTMVIRPGLFMDPFIHISMSRNGILDLIVDATPEHSKGSFPSKRFALYDTDHILQGPETWYRYKTADSLSLNQHEVYNTVLAARNTAKWLFSLPLERTQIGPELNFQLTSSGTSESSTMIGDILGRWPGIFRLCGSQPDERTAAFKPPSRPRPTKPLNVYRHNGKEPVFENGVVASIDAEDDEFHGPNLIRDCFPKIQDLLDLVRERCNCPNCARKGPFGGGKSGCLQKTLMMLHSTLIAHATADGFGANDASGLVENRDIEYEVYILLAEVIKCNTVRWDRWFALASSIFLGCSPPIHHLDEKEGAGTLLAVQFGSMVVAANWADFRKSLKVDGLLGFESVASQISGMSSEEAVLQAEKTMERSCKEDPELEGEGWLFDDEEEISKYSIGQEVILDELKVEEGTPVLGTYVFKSSRPKSYRLITLLETTKYHRYINPAGAVLSIINSRKPVCMHQSPALSASESAQPVLATEKTIVSWSLDDMLGCWGTSNDPLRLTASEAGVSKESSIARTYVTEALDSDLKVNVALALSPLGCVIRNPKKCCLQCALKESCLFNGGTPNYASRRVLTQVTESRSTGMISKVR